MNCRSCVCRPANRTVSVDREVSQIRLVICRNVFAVVPSLLRSAGGGGLPTVTVTPAQMELLDALAKARSKRLSVNALAERLIWSERTVSRHLSKLLHDGLVDRKAGRKGGVALTALGWNVVGRDGPSSNC